VGEAEKTRRIVALQSLQKSIQLEIHESMVGTSVEVFVDTVSRRHDHELSGRTLGNTVVSFQGPPQWLGRTVAVTIHKAGPYSVTGDAIRFSELDSIRSEA
jgi:tRNA-2-methylthio-N6-dimethylallyladenosine synthase